MKFDSFEYLFVFLPITLTLYHLLRTKTLLANLLILVASYIFYAWGNGWVLILLIFSSVTDYYIGAAIHASPTPTGRKAFLVLSCVFNLGLLSIFKYADWVSGMLHAHWAVIPVLALRLPYGI